MNVNFTLTGSIDVPDAILSILEAKGQSVAEFVNDLFDGALPESLAAAELTVEDETSEPVRANVSAKETMRAVKAPQSARLARPAATQDTDGMVPARSGRPPLKKEADGTRWEASDGGTVTEFGNRSVQELKTQGIAARKVGAVQWPRWYETALAAAELNSDEDDTDDTESWTPAPRKNLQIPKSERRAQTSAAVAASAPVMRSRTRTK